ncbi:MAG: hypothetical protein WBQ14_08250 [Gaiellaceae bacterium]
MDRHKLWRIVGNNYGVLEGSAPKGHTPVVEVFLRDRTKPVRIGLVQTDPDPEFPWTLFVVDRGGEGGDPSPKEHLVLVREQDVERVELLYERSDGQPIGFTYKEFDDAPSSSGA